MSLQSIVLTQLEQYGIDAYRKLPSRMSRLPKHKNLFLFYLFTGICQVSFSYCCSEYGFPKTQGIEEEEEEGEKKNGLSVVFDFCFAGVRMFNIVFEFSVFLLYWKI